MASRLGTNRRTVAIVGALLLAAVATFAIYTYVDGLRDQAFDQAELVEVYVASDDIPTGTDARAAIDAELVSVADVAREDRPDGAVTSLDQIDGLVALERVLPGEVLQEGRFGAPGSVQSTSFQVPEGLQAMSVEVGVPPGVAGFVGTGSRISVVSHLTAPGGAAPQGDEEAPAGDGVDQTRSRFVVQDIQVLAVGRRVASSDGEGESPETAQPTETVLVTVAVTDQQAEQLVFALNEGTLHLTLLPDGYEPRATPGRSFDTLFDGQAG